jgi:hypothetical protein
MLILYRSSTSLLITRNKIVPWIIKLNPEG